MVEVTIGWVGEDGVRGGIEGTGIGVRGTTGGFAWDGADVDGESVKNSSTEGRGSDEVGDSLYGKWVEMNSTCRE